MWRHGTQRDLPHALIELRQDLIGDQRGQVEWADRLTAILRRLAQCDLGVPDAPALDIAPGPRRRRAPLQREDYS
jgi:hypothetical protein